MIPGVGNTESGSQQTNTTSTSSTGIDSMASEQTFLKLFVAQLENQDPLNPQDATQFVAQLAQFSSVEQEIQMREDLDSINKAVTTQDSGTQGTAQQ